MRRDIQAAGAVLVILAVLAFAAPNFPRWWWGEEGVQTEEIEATEEASEVFEGPQFIPMPTEEEPLSSEVVDIPVITGLQPLNDDGTPAGPFIPASGVIEPRPLETEIWLIAPGQKKAGPPEKTITR